MKKFIKITTRNADGSIVRTWMDDEQVAAVSQDTSQEGNNEGTLLFFDGETRDIIAFNETLLFFDGETRDIAFDQTLDPS